MKHKKEFFGVLLSVVICVLIVVAGVYAGTTTVSSFISVNGASTNTAHNTEFGVVGTASISEDLWASGSFQFGGGDTVATVSYSRLGGTATGHSLADADDLIVNGILEVDETAYFDSMVQIGNTGSAPYTELSVVGTASISEDLWASGSFQFGGGDTTASLSYSRLGTGTTGHSLIDADDLLISGLLEVNETAFLDAAASVAADLSVEGGDFSVSGTSRFAGLASVSDASGLLIGGGAKLFGGTASPGGATLNCTVGSWYFRAGQAASTSIYFCGTANEWDQVTGLDTNN